MYIVPLLDNSNWTKDLVYLMRGGVSTGWVMPNTITNTECVQFTGAYTKGDTVLQIDQGNPDVGDVLLSGQSLYRIVNKDLFSITIRPPLLRDIAADEKHLILMPADKYDPFILGEDAAPLEITDGVLSECSYNTTIEEALVGVLPITVNTGTLVKGATLVIGSMRFPINDVIDNLVYTTKMTKELPVGAIWSQINTQTIKGMASGAGYLSLDNHYYEVLSSENGETVLAAPGLTTTCIKGMIGMFFKGIN